MKFIAVVLAMYIMVLIAMPCNDNHSANTNSVNVELSEQSSNHANDADLCSPFCFCDCCQTLSFPSEPIFLEINVNVITLNISYIVSSFLSPILSIWQPPQL